MTIKNTTGLHPTADKILVEPCRVQEKHGSIVLAQQALDKEQLAQVVGTVLAFGNTSKMRVQGSFWTRFWAALAGFLGIERSDGSYSLCPELDGIEVGDLILYARYAGAPFPVDGVEYRLLRPKDVLGRCDRLPDSVIRGALSSVEAFGFNEAAKAA